MDTNHRKERVKRLIGRMARRMDMHPSMKPNVKRDTRFRIVIGTQLFYATTFKLADTLAKTVSRLWPESMATILDVERKIILYYETGSIVYQHQV